MNSNTCINTQNHSYQKWAIGNDIRELLLTNPNIVGRVGSNIYPLIAPENTTGDFILYMRDRYKKTLTKVGVVEDECRLNVIVISDSYDNALYLASEIDNTLTGRHTKDDARITINLFDSTESFENNKYIETLVFEIN